MDGKALLIDLTSRDIKTIKIQEKIFRKYIGGVGLATYLFMKNISPDTAALSEENAIVISVGPAQKTDFPFSGRHCIVTKSPLTSAIIDSHVGGHIGPAMAKTGYDSIIIKGKSEKPISIYISDENIEFIDATHLWGKTTWETEKTLEKNYKNIYTMSIGPAGENGVLFSSVISEGYRAAGRGGIGAVFGYKKLKSISFHTVKEKYTSTSQEYSNTRKQIIERNIASKKMGNKFFIYGTPIYVEIANSLDMLPTRNFSSGQFESWEDISGRLFYEKYKTEKKICDNCPMGCSSVITSFKHIDHPVSVPEYETIAMCGSNLGISDTDTIVEINNMCNELGLDTISTGSVIAFIMECYTKNTIPEELTAEKIYFGDKIGALNLIEKIAYKKGIGKYASEGTRKLSKYIGKNTSDFAIQVKGLEMAAWDPRGKKGLGLSYATAAAGASHLRGWPKTNEIPDSTAIPVIDSLIEAQHLKIIVDSLILCHFTHSIYPPLDINLAVDVFNATTGFGFSKDEVITTTERIWVLQRIFNVSAIGPDLKKTDTLPARILKEQLPTGAAKGCKAFITQEDFELCRDTFYNKRGLDEKGIPTKEKILELRLEEFSSFI